MLLAHDDAVVTTSFVELIYFALFFVKHLFSKNNSLQDKAICQDEFKFAMGNRDKAIAEYKELMRKTGAVRDVASESS